MISILFSKIRHKLIHFFLKKFYGLLYHEFAWAYDFVAWLVSWGQWRNWTQSILQFIKGTSVLELGHGPGHLANAMDPTITYFGIDQSRQMSRIAQRNANRHSSRLNWIRAEAENIPFVNHSFETVIATFPSEYIFQPATLKSCSRILKPDGELIILLGVKFTSANFSSRILKTIYDLFQQSPPNDQFGEQIQGQFLSHGLNPKLDFLDFKTYQLIFVRAKPMWN